MVALLDGLRVAELAGEGVVEGTANLCVQFGGGLWVHAAGCALLCSESAFVAMIEEAREHKASEQCEGFGILVLSRFGVEEGACVNDCVRLTGEYRSSRR